MDREDVLSDLLRKDINSNPNIVLLKKFIFCVNQGWFRINGLAPDKAYTLGDYLQDDERIIFDYTLLSDEAKERFESWFLLPHAEDARMAFLSGVATNDYRGYTAEVGLSWWGRITNLFFYQKKSYHWNLAPLELSLDYQLTGIEICKGKQGILIGLQQFATANTVNKYHKQEDNQEEPLRNVKRLVLTDDLVDSITQANLDQQDFDAMIYKPHPFSVEVNRSNQRFQDMLEYRQTQRLIAKLPWYIRLWRWSKSKLNKPLQSTDYEMEELQSDTNHFQTIIQKGNIKIAQHPSTAEILITEKRPELVQIVLCGGGGKIYAHLGALYAFEMAGISFEEFAGSSAGGLMAILCYLGYSTDEIFNFFRGFRQENLVHYDIDSSGISDTKALKAALDFMIVQKVNQIIERFKIDESSEGRRFLANEVLHKNKITFASLRAIKTRYPDCGLGDDLILTATNVKQRKTRYFSDSITPDLEVSAAGEMSASLPVFFKPILFEGEVHSDGGTLNNLPTEPFRDNRRTLLASEHGNSLRLIALQFDNGCERGILDKVVDRVYRENFILNWIYALLTGVKDPVSGWERDRLKLLQHSNQVVLLPVGDVSATQFDVDVDAQKTLIRNGYFAAKNYIDARYNREEDEAAQSEEYMYAKFTNIEEALYFTCFRNREDWFEIIAEKAIEQGMEEEAVQALRERHFPSDSPGDNQDDNEQRHSPTFFSGSVSSYVEKQIMKTNMHLFEAIYPLLLKLPCSMIKNPRDLKLYKYARHIFSLHSPHPSIDVLQRINGEVHVLFAILVQLIERYTKGVLDSLDEKLIPFISLIKNDYILQDPTFFGCWKLLPRQSERILLAFQNGHFDVVKEICESLKNNEEPLQNMTEESFGAKGHQSLAEAVIMDNSKGLFDDYHLSKNMLTI